MSPIIWIFGFRPASSHETQSIGPGFSPVFNRLPITTSSPSATSPSHFHCDFHLTNTVAFAQQHNINNNVPLPITIRVSPYGPVALKPILSRVFSVDWNLTSWKLASLLLNRRYLRFFNKFFLKHWHTHNPSFPRLEPVALQWFDDSRSNPLAKRLEQNPALLSSSAPQSMTDIRENSIIAENIPSKRNPAYCQEDPCHRPQASMVPASLHLLSFPNQPIPNSQQLLSQMLSGDYLHGSRCSPFCEELSDLKNCALKHAINTQGIIQPAETRHAILHHIFTGAFFTGDSECQSFRLNNIKLLEFFAIERARANQMAHTRSNNPRLDDDARHLTQDYPAFGENLSRASSRSSTVSQASRSAYPGVLEEILERVSQAKTARLAARARYEAALANSNQPSSVITKLEDELSKSEDELKFTRIKRTRAKFSSQHINSSRSPLPPSLPVPPLLQNTSRSPLRRVFEGPAPSLEQGEDLRKPGYRVNVEGDFGDRRASMTTNEINLPRTERDSAELLGHHVATLPGWSLPPILVSPLLQIATRFCSQPVPEDKFSMAALDRKTAKVTDRFNSTRSEYRDHAKHLDRHVNPEWSLLPPILTSSPLPLEDPALPLEQGVEWRRMGYRTDVRENELKFGITECNGAKLPGQPIINPPGLPVPPPMFAPPPLPPEFEDPAPLLEWGEEQRRHMLNQGSGSKMGEEVEIVGEREEGTRNVLDSRAQLPEKYEYRDRSTTSAVPLGREQSYAQNVSRTVNCPVLHHETPPMSSMQQMDESEPDEQHKVCIRTFANQESATSKGLSGVYQHQYLHARVELAQDEDEEQVPYLVPPNMSTHQGRMPRPLARPPEQLVTAEVFLSALQHIVGGFGGGGDPEGSSHWSSESDHGDGNGGGGRPPGQGNGDPGDPDHNDEGQSDDCQPRRGRHGKDRDDEPRCGPCGGGPPGGDPPDDGEPEGGKDGNSKRSNRKDSKRRGVTQFSEIPEEGSLHYGYESSSTKSNC
ncbi:hypothetical protein K435DRAFT_867419 [Dendrothele bispora CBS 962.96]|uniref:Uncharacterized protein n=1 Tax=Dendrothele bispora (strain CBS 962.96) TaxID=1314807 RepID=A0A4S8LEC3_DENBC|nr:hypothetical protein K435DRAFT_867419 [Dendrothele bispora CBS 962.96]